MLGGFFAFVGLVVFVAGISLSAGYAVGCSATMRAGVDVAEGRVQARLSTFALRDLIWATLFIALVCGSLHQQVRLNEERDRRSLEVGYCSRLASSVFSELMAHGERLSDRSVDDQLLRARVQTLEARLRALESESDLEIAF